MPARRLLVSGAAGGRRGGRRRGGRWSGGSWSDELIAGARRAPAFTITAVLALAYVILAPPSTDLAAAAYRSDLFARAGFTLWDNAWYGGHHLPAYSLLAPALGALIGPQLLTGLSMTTATGLFAALIEGHFPARASRLAAIWFALGASIALLANRVPFDLGLAIGIGALVLAQRERRAAALVLAALCALASPVAGAFLALAAVAWAFHHRAPSFPAALAAAALAPIALLVLAFPEGGNQPFVASAFYPALAGVLLIAALIPAEQGPLRTGAILYAVVLIGAYLVPTAVGGNADRLGALVAGPLAACVLAGGRRVGGRPRMLIVLAPFLLYWQANAPIADFASAAGDPAVGGSYYAPLLGELRTLGIGYSGRPARIEVVPSRDHWEARWVAERIMIARGWERQLDGYRNPLFYEASRPLTAARYRAWLSEEAISYVALPDAPLDYSAESEGRLLRGAGRARGQRGTRAGGVSYLREVWHSAHWRLFAYLDARPLAQAPALLTGLTSDTFTLEAPAAGTFVVRVHFTPYWALARGSGCVARAPGDWTQVRARAGGSFRVVIDFSLTRVFEHGSRCN